MIFYDDNYNMLGIDDESLKILGYDDFEQFKEDDVDVSDFFIKKEGYVHKINFCNWLDFLIYSEESDSRVLLSDKKGNITENKIIIKEIYPLCEINDSKIIYMVDFIKVDEDTYQSLKSNIELEDLSIDEDFYIDLLKDFFVENDNYMGKILYFANDEKYSQAKKIIFILQSICNNLKLDDLADILQNIEESIEKEDKSRIEELMKIYQNKIEAYKKLVYKV